VIEEMLGGEGASAYRPLSAAHYPQDGPGGGGYGLVDHGIHMLDVFPWLCDSSIERVFGRGDRTGHEPRTEFAHLQMRNGATGILIYDGSTRPAVLPSAGVFSEAGTWIDGRGWMGDAGEWDSGAGIIEPVRAARGTAAARGYGSLSFRCADARFLRKSRSGRGGSDFRERRHTRLAWVARHLCQRIKWDVGESAGIHGFLTIGTPPDLRGMIGNTM
jgi:predicted dehydrogenase